RGPLLRATLLRLRPEEQVVMLVMHHIVSDGWSLGVLVRELVALYEAETKNEPALLPALPVQYVDYTVRRWKHNSLTGGGNWRARYRCCNCRWTGRARQCRASAAQVTLSYCRRR